MPEPKPKLMTLAEVERAQKMCDAAHRTHWMAATPGSGVPPHAVFTVSPVDGLPESLIGTMFDAQAAQLAATSVTTLPDALETINALAGAVRVLRRHALSHDHECPVYDHPPGECTCGLDSVDRMMADLDAKENPDA